MDEKLIAHAVELLVSGSGEKLSRTREFLEALDMQDGTAPEPKIERTKGRKYK